MSDTENDDLVELVACIRCLLGKRPLRPEPVGIAAFRFSLDGQRKQTRNEWALKLGVSRQAVDQRYERLRRRFDAGMPEAEAYALAMAPPQTRKTNHHQEPRNAHA